MIQVGYLYDGKGYIKFGGNVFDQVLNFVKRKKYRYNPKEKRWEGSVKKLKDDLVELNDFEEVSIKNEDKKLIEEKSNEVKPEETVFKRTKFNNQCLLKPPIKGKPPHEDFQLTSIKKGVNQNRLALFLKMGLGKTFITINIFNHFFHENRCDKLLIVAPSEGVYNWRQELYMFSNFAKSEKDIVISSANNNRDPFNLEVDPKVIIMTYRHFLTLSDDYYKRLNGKKSKNYRTPVIPFDSWGTNRGIVLDESHALKNITSRQSKVLHLHKEYFYYRYLLTGTPAPNLFTELYSQMKFLEPGLFDENYYDWLEEVASVGNRFSAYAINYVKKDKSKEWEEKFSPWVIRYKSEDVLDLPELYVKPIYAEMTDLQKQIYEAIIDYMVYKVKEENDGVLEPKLLANKFPWISLSYENADLLKGKIDPIESAHLAKLVDKFNFTKHHGKLEILDSLVKRYLEDEKQKVTVSDFHPATLDKLAEIYKKYNPIVIHGRNTPRGEDPVKWRNEQLDKFRYSKKHNLLLGSSKVLTTAINLVECNRVINFSRSYSYVDNVQFMKRFHRIGQDQRVIINNLIFEQSLDVRLNNALNNKKDLDESIFNKQSLSQKEWRNIFKGKV